MNSENGTFFGPKERWLGRAVGIMFLMLGMLVVPSGELWNGFSVTRSLVPESTFLGIPDIRREIEEISAEMQRHESGYDSGDTAFMHMNRLWKLERRVPIDDRGGVTGDSGRMMMRLNQLKMKSTAMRVTGDHARNDAIHKRFGELRDTHPDSIVGMSLPPRFATEYRWELVPRHLLRRLLLTMCIAPIFFVFMLVHYGRLIEELGEYFVLRIAFASAIWPIAMWYFPHRFLVEHVRRGLVWVRYSMSGALAVAPALAQTVQKCDPSAAKKGREVASVVPAAAGAARSSDPPKGAFAFDIFGDTLHDRQFNWRYTRKALTFFNQNRSSADGRSSISVLNVGTRISSKRLVLFASAGPQYTGEKGRIDRTIAFLNGSVTADRLTIKFLNRLSFGHEGSATPFAHRHIQDVRGSPLPLWLSFEGEELRSAGKWRELFFGPKINIGGLTRVKGLGFLSLYPHWDGAKGNFDMRIWLSFTFAQ